MKHLKIVTIFLILQMAVVLPIYTQEEGGEDVIKYTVKEYLEVNLPPQEARKIVLDEITGLLTITDTPANQQLALQLIREWDVGPKQIQIEAKFIEITFTDLDELGIEWEFQRTDSPVLGNYTGDIYDTTGINPDTLLSGMMGAAETFADATTTSGLGLMIGKALISGNTLRAYLKALEQSGKANLLNAPRITTLSGQMANIQVVRSFPYATSAERTVIELETGTEGTLVKQIYPVETYEIEEEIVGITLEVTPTVIEGSDIITLEIHPEVTKLSQQVAITTETSSYIDFPDDLGWPIIDTRTAQTTVMVRSGETIIIGGLIQDEDFVTVERKIPFLGDIPLIGPLFKYKYEKREKKNLIVVLTASLISAQGEEIR